MPISVPLRVSRSGGEKGKSRAKLDVSSVRHSATGFKASGSVESSPALCRKARSSSLPRVAAKWALARWVIALSEAASCACSVTDSEA